MGPKPLKGGDTVLVQGTGGVSIFGLQVAVAAGAVVIATSSSDEKLKVAAKLGAKHLINYNKRPNWDQEVLKIVRFTFSLLQSRVLTCPLKRIDEWKRCKPRP